LAPTIFPLLVTSSNIVITWSAISNTSYRVQFKSILDATNWSDVAGDVVASSNIAFTVDGRTTNRFYRIQVLP
jgi:hypothetical protein